MVVAPGDHIELTTWYPVIPAMREFILTPKIPDRKIACISHSKFELLVNDSDVVAENLWPDGLELN